LVDGFDRSPFIMMTYNPPYYEKLFQAAGLEKSQDLYAFWGHIDMLGGLDAKLKYMSDCATERFGIAMRPMNKKKFRQEVEMFLDIYNQSMAGTWGFVPLSANEIRHMAAGMKYLIQPRLAVEAEVQGKPIGASFAMLDYNPRIKEIDGRLLPFGFAKLLGNKRGIKNMRVISTNVVPEYQAWGVGLVLLGGLLPMVHEWGIREAEFSWVLESNKLSRGSLERGGAVHYKTYRLYEMELGK
jgi:GNAT superfamily N-acetyltransferase